jgi:hypothetical protein
MLAKSADAIRLRAQTAAGLLVSGWLSVSVGGCTPSSASSATPKATPDQVAAICSGIPEKEWQRPIFFQASDIEGIRPFMGERRYIKFTLPELRGADIFVRAGPGITKQWVARVIRCHVAWHDVYGPASQESFEDPLVVGRPDLSFMDNEIGFVIRIAGHDKAEGEEILRRAQMLRDQRSDAARD